jgi:hypothetical protein
MSVIRNRQERKAPVDYKEPYEFRLLLGDNIICQRYFRINNFNPLSLGSAELTNTIRACAQMIDDDLKAKSRVYTWHMAPLVFKNEDEMRKWFANPGYVKGIRMGETIVLRDEAKTEYTWDGEKLVECEKKIDDGTFTTELTDRDTLTYEFAFYVNDRKIISTSFDGVYPYFIRRNIDLSNMKGKFEGDDVSRLGFDSYILNCLVADHPDLIKKIVKEICYVCSVAEDDYYTTYEVYKTPGGKEMKYALNLTKNVVYANYADEIARAKKYLYGSNNGPKA